MWKSDHISEEEVDHIIDMATQTRCNDIVGKGFIKRMVRKKWEGKTPEEIICNLKEALEQVKEKKDFLKKIKHSYQEAIQMLLEKVEK